MATLLGSLLVSLGLESGEFRSGLGAAEKQFRSFQRNIESAGKDMAGLGAKMSVAISLPLVALGKASVDAAKQSQDAIGQVESALASMGKQAGLTSDQLQELASGIMRKSLYDDDDILRQVTANLLTFGNVTQDVFKRAEQVAVDLSARLGQDLQSSTIQVGKALNNPIKGIAALQRVGVQFTQSQKDQIATLIKSGNVMDAQRLILSELEKEFGGAAEAARKADPFGALKQSFNDFQEQVGGKLLQILPTVTNAIMSLLNAFNALPDSMQQGIVIAGVLAAAFGPLLTVIGSLIQFMSPLIAVMKMGALGATEAGLAFAGLRGSLMGLGATITTFAGTVGGLVAIMALLTAGSYALYVATSKGTGASKASAAAQDEAAKATDTAQQAIARLSTETGKARDQTLSFLKVQAELARQHIETTKAALQQARANLILAQTEAAKSNDAQKTVTMFGGSVAPGAALAAQAQTGAVNEGKVNTARADAEAREKALKEWQTNLENIEKALNAGAVAPPKLNVDLPTEHHNRGRQPKDRTAEITKQFNDQLASLTQETLSAQESMAKNAQQAAEYQLRSVEIARLRTIDDIKINKDFSDVQKERLTNQVEELADQERARIEFDKTARLEQEQQALLSQQHDAQRDALQTQLDLADNQADRKRIALQILDAEQQYLRQTLQAVLDSKTAGDAEKQRAQVALNSLNANASAQRQSVARQNETPAEKFRRELVPTGTALNEAIDQIKIDGLNSLNDGLVDAIVNFKSLGAVAKQVIQQVLGDLLSLQIRRGIIDPLAGALGLGGGSSKIGGNTKSLEANFDKVFGDGGSAAGLTAAGSTLTTAGTGLNAAAAALQTAAASLSTSASAGAVTGGGGGGFLKGVLDVAGIVAGSTNFGGKAISGAKAVGSSVVGGASAARKLKFFANGTDFAPRGLGIVGEAGPELISFRGGEKVISNRELVGMQNPRNANGRGAFFNVSVNGAMSDRAARRTGTQMASEGGRKWAQARKAGLA